MISSRDNFDPLLILSFKFVRQIAEGDWTVVKSFFLFEFDPQPSPSSTFQIVKGRLFDCHVITLWDNAGLNYIGHIKPKHLSIERIGVLARYRNVVGVFYSHRPHVKTNVVKERDSSEDFAEKWMNVGVCHCNWN